MKRRFFYVFVALLSYASYAQETVTDSTATTQVSVAENPKIAKLQAENEKYRLELQGLETNLPALEQKADELAREARSSADDNKDAARKLQSDVTDGSKARKARKAARQAEKDSDKAEKAQSDLDDARKDIGRLKKRIEKNEKKIVKLQSGT